MDLKVNILDCMYSLAQIQIPNDPNEKLEIGMNVIFKDGDGKEEFGVVRALNRDPFEDENYLKNSKILRVATANDIQRMASNVERSENAFDSCKELIAKHNLDMIVFRCAYSFDGSKVHFMFTADERIDFRELVKDLAKVLKKQIHLRQIGPRDKAKLIGGYGRCGRILCCNTFLGNLESISMDMVRDQGLENKGSSKLSGACGKLLCCLKYEVFAYKELRKGLPLVGDKVRTKKSSVIDQKDCNVIGVDVLNRKLKLICGDDEICVVGADEIEKVLKSVKN